MTFLAEAYPSFQYSNWSWSAKTGQLQLNYRMGQHVFTEVITFPDAPQFNSADHSQAFDLAAHNLHLIAGISYYKTSLAPHIELSSTQLSEQYAHFLEKLYYHGLGEFAFTNHLDLSHHISFPAKPDYSETPIRLNLPRRSLLPLGGGKDSLVSLEWLRQTDEAFTPAFIGSSELIKNTAKTAGMPYLQIQRKLSPLLAELNQQGAYNGHIPITAINSAILTLAAILYGYDRIIFSNEHSANVGNLVLDNGFEVNHQYSKSLAFEVDYQHHIRTRLSPSIQYVSLLRSLNEISIVKAFARFTQYHAVFSSCNRNFHLSGSQNTQGLWCGNCPKCHFTFLTLAVFLPQAEVIAIFGKNLLDDPEQIPGFLALAGLGQNKPFECVGEIEESRAALAELLQLEAWQHCAVLNAIKEPLQSVTYPKLSQLVSLKYLNRVPDNLKSQIHALH